MPDPAAGVAPASIDVGAAWVDAVVLLGGTRSVAWESGVDLALRYAQPHRRYHTAEHIAAVLAVAGPLAAATGLDRYETAAVLLAGCAHDVVYDMAPGADERASADWAREALTAAGLNGVVADRVAGLVLVTADHDPPPDDLAADVLVDADLAILGSRPAEYERYVRAVRQEYREVAEPEWRVGRAAVLQGLLAGSLYRTWTAQQRWDVQARENVSLELAGLRAGSGGQVGPVTPDRGSTPVP